MQRSKKVKSGMQVIFVSVCSVFLSAGACENSVGLRDKFFVDLVLIFRKILEGERLLAVQVKAQ